MATYVGLLRAVNVGGTGRLPMPSLQKLVEGAGFQQVRTVLQSGNLVFHGPDRPTATIEATLESALERRLGLGTGLFVRTAEEWRSVIQKNPFPEFATEDPAHLTVHTVRSEPPKRAWSALKRVIVGRERVEPGDRCAYIVYPDGLGRSKLTPAVLEHGLGVRGTTRNWNTVTRLAALIPS